MLKLLNGKSKLNQCKGLHQYKYAKTIVYK